MDIYPQRPASDHGKSGVNAAELAPRFILAVGQLERDWGHRKPPDPLLRPGINTINAGVMQVGRGSVVTAYQRLWETPRSYPTWPGVPLVHALLTRALRVAQTYASLSS
jgi:hypothetical protein